MEPNQNITPQTNPAPATPASSAPNQANKTATVKYFAGQINASTKPATLDLSGDKLTLTNTETKQLVFSTLVSSIKQNNFLNSMTLNTDQVSLKIDGKRYSMNFATVTEADDWRSMLYATSPGGKKTAGVLNKTLRIAVAICILVAIAHAIAVATHK